VAELSEMSGLELLYWQVYFKLEHEEHEQAQKKRASSNTEDHTLD
jgi:hypothetical protein